MATKVTESQAIEVHVATELPHVIYPKGPIRQIVDTHPLHDAVAGVVTIARLECGHVVTLLCLRTGAIVRCPHCFYESHRGPSQLVELEETEICDGLD